MVYIDQTDVYDVTNASRFFTRRLPERLGLRGLQGGVSITGALLSCTTDLGRGWIHEREHSSN